MTQHPSLSLSTKNEGQVGQRPNVRLETLKFLEEREGNIPWLYPR